MAILPFGIVAHSHKRAAAAQLLHHKGQNCLPGIALGLVVIVGRLPAEGVVVRKGAEDGVVPHPHCPKAVQHLVHPVGYQVPMVGEVDHLNPLPLLCGVPGEQPGKEQLLVVPVGTEQQQIRLPRGDFLPALHPLRQGAGGENPQLVQSGLPGAEAKGHRPGGMAQAIPDIQIAVE